MKGKILYLVSFILIVLPWLFLFEVLPIPYHQLSVFVEVLIEGTMFVLLFICMVRLRRELKRLKAPGLDKAAQSKMYKVINRILYVFSSLTLVVLGLVLLLIGISFSL